MEHEMGHPKLQVGVEKDQWIRDFVHGAAGDYKYFRS